MCHRSLADRSLHWIIRLLHEVAAAIFDILGADLPWECHGFNGIEPRKMVISWDLTKFTEFTDQKARTFPWLFWHVDCWKQRCSPKDSFSKHGSDLRLRTIVLVSNIWLSLSTCMCIYNMYIYIYIYDTYIHIYIYMWYIRHTCIHICIVRIMFV